ncbi:transcription elongation factor GreA [Parasaccharibacter sp. TMW2.1882]|nr:transcription elongation factor GreA [Parasaccharibacter sp. TMW2.1882]
MPRTIAACISARLASLYELQTVYGVKDLYDLLEIASVQAGNERRAHQAAQRQAQQ